MKDLSIGTVFVHPEIGVLKVCEEGAVNECYGCVFNGAKRCYNDTYRYHTGECAADMRIDRTGVIFVKEKED